MGGTRLRPRVAVDRELVALIGVGVGVRIVCLLVGVVVAGSVQGTVFAWDGGHYLLIASRGYPPGQPLESAFSWAFFPVWPAVLALLVRLPIEPWIPVVILGIALTALDMALIARFLEPTVGRRESRFVALCWAVAPPAWIYLAAYSEGLYVAVEVALLLAMANRRPLAVAALAFLIGLSRPQGAIWALAAAWWLVRYGAAERARLQPLLRRLSLAAVALSGAAIWQITVSIATGILGGWFAIEALPGWEMGFGFATWTTALGAIQGLLGGVVDTHHSLGAFLAGSLDRRSAIIPVMLAVLVGVVGLARRRETLIGRWPTILVGAQALFVSGGIGGIPRFVAAAPLIFLGVSRPVLNRRVLEVVLIVGLTLASIGFTIYNLSSFGSNP